MHASCVRCFILTSHSSRYCYIANVEMCQMLWFGSVVDLEKNSEDTVALRNLGKKIHRDDRVNMSFLTIGDGTILAFKK